MTAMLYTLLFIHLAALATLVVRRLHRAASAGLGTGRHRRPRTVQEHADDLEARYGRAPFDPTHPWADATTRRVRRRS